MKEELIPCDDELTRLKEFLLNQKRDRYEREMPCGVEWREKWLASRKKPEGSKCLRCGDPLFGLVTGLCNFCLEERQKEVKDSYEMPGAWYEPD